MTAPVSPVSLVGQTAFITGAAGGLGSSIAELFADHGANIVVSDLERKADTLAKLAHRLSLKGVKAHVAIADMSDSQAVRKVVAESLDQVGSLDILVNCAGHYPEPRPLLEFEESAWLGVLEVNLHGPVAACRAMLPSMIERRRGCIINIASDSALMVAEGDSAYGIAKLGLVRLASYLASEYGCYGVRANSIAPGWIRTPLTERYWTDPDTMASIARSVPVGRMAEPTEIANVALFLASGMASYVTGHCIVVDGGRVSGCPA